MLRVPKKRILKYQQCFVRLGESTQMNINRRYVSGFSTDSDGRVIVFGGCATTGNSISATSRTHSTCKRG